MIEIMPETAEDIVAVRISKKLTDNEYMQVLLPKMEEAINRYGRSRVLVHMDEGYRGFELRVLLHDFKFGVQHRNDFTKAAVVGASKWMERVSRAAGCLFSGEIRTFPPDRLQEALEWISKRCDCSAHS